MSFQSATECQKFHLMHTECTFYCWIHMRKWWSHCRCKIT